MISATSSNAVMSMQRTSVRSVLPSSIAAADVLRTPIISMAISMMRMTSAVSCRENVSNVLSC